VRAVTGAPRETRAKDTAICSGPRQSAFFFQMMCRDSTCHASCQLPRHEAKRSSRELSLEHLALADSSAHTPSLPMNDSADDDYSRTNRDGSMEDARCVVENLKAILLEESIRRQNLYA
jgi:hypothetical protein